MAPVLTLKRSGALLLALLVAAPLSSAQYPPYPTGQYPPGQYPPSPYPTQVPPDTVAVRLPGGVPIGVPVPQVKLPKGKDKKDKNGDVKMTLRSVDGTLREIREKDLFLERSPQRLLRFRVLVKTQFRDKQGQPVRDSLLKPGDQLSVQVNGDDPETAFRVILLRAGTENERTAASRPFDRTSAQTPVESDTRPAGTIEVANDAGAPSGESASNSSSPDVDPGRPKLERKPGGIPQKDPEPIASQIEGGVDEVIAAARDAAATFSQEMPNFIVQQYTTRYYSFTIPAQWRVQDVVSAEVACVDGVEQYRNIQVNGKASRAPIEKTGSWSTGEFVTTLQDILSPATAAVFVRSGEDVIAGRPVYVYNLTVRKTHSHWKLIAPDGRWEYPAYTGRIWIDKERHRVLRTEQRSVALSADFPFDKAESTLDYDFVRIDSKMHLLPSQSENLMCVRGTANCTKNEIAFRNYRKFASDSNITFDRLLPVVY